jgi:hypothetical protein
VSRRPVLMHPRLVRCFSGPRNGGEQKSSTSGESTSRKSLALGVIPRDGTEMRRGNTYEQGESRRGEGR